MLSYKKLVSASLKVRKRENLKIPRKRYSSNDVISERHSTKNALNKNERRKVYV